MKDQNQNPLGALLNALPALQALTALTGQTQQTPARGGRFSRNKVAYSDIPGGSGKVTMTYNGAKVDVAVKLQAGENGRTFVVFDGPDKWRSIALDAYIAIVEPSVVRAVAELAAKAK